MPHTKNQLCSCACGATEVTIKRQPFMRIYCHCEFCQDFNNAPYGDVCAVLPDDVEVTKGSVNYKRYSPMVRRGACSECGKPAIEYFNGPRAMQVAGVPTANFPDQSELPEAACHGFYHRRQQNVDDGLPKYSGFVASQLGFARHVIPALLKRGR